ncbi:type II and III secretion system protein family protein [Hydrogenovibrio sp. JE_KL2]|uniref:type II and III secretion system protein family protein n=1 Tax=Hydrogenovibrio sp. JE_KL2 TaxID=2651188 RepID=UPI00128DF0FC|nr:pilus assembly protein N-terminal domain-containing protein [Hydrogenovibrio sp. JE_KL2]MBN2607366.1 pilus assembly protein N-terminal domain-containing protein [Thiotrichales bacterium]MPQ77581.1 type II and III secretion system protein [Hydrogenovibrio sp. JE_KL2]
MKALNKLLSNTLSMLLLSMLSFPLLAAEKSYSLMATESIIVKFDSPIKRALIANPDLANLKVLNAKELLVSGKQAGRTEVIVWYQNTPNQGHNIVLNISPDASRRAEISKTVNELISQLDPDKTVSFELKNIWIDSTSSVRRELDNLGNQIDDDATLKVKAGENKDILQQTQKAGQLSIRPIAGNYMVLLKGTVPHKARKKRIQAVISSLGLSVVNMIKVVGKDQVKLSVRVAEVTKGNPFRSGMAIRDKKDRFGIFPPGNLGTQALFSLNNSPSNDAKIAFPQPDGFQLGFNPRNGSIFGVLSILEGHNLARVLAKPELVVQSGETASFLVGGEVPIPTAQSQDTITVTYKEYGIRLRFSPIITEDGNIQLTVAPEVSNIDESAGAQTGNVIVPGFKSRKANTTITLAPGQSFIIGGLLSDNLRSQVNKVPILGDIPILGTLFRSTSYEEDKSELAILVTPTLVDPIGAGRKIVLPGENVTRASDFDGFFLGKVAKVLPEGESALPKSMVKIGLETVE